MRYSHFFGKTSKSQPADADSINARLLTQGGFIAQQMAGVYNYLPLGLKVLRKIENIIREEMAAVGAHEILMPALTQAESYETTGRDAMAVLFATMGVGEKHYFLNPTHEEVVTPLVKNFTFSYRDLPLAVFQIQNKFRNEPRAKSGLLRGREFSMKDLYSFHATEEDLNSYYQKMQEVYFTVFKRLGFGNTVVLTYASGGDFARYSHEFQALSAVGEDTVFLCEKCRVAVNKEIVEELNACPECQNVDLKPERAIEVGNIFKLRTRFSDAFHFTYTDELGARHLVEMGCYGIGPSRIMGTLVEIFHDDKGIVWPESVAPFQVHLVNLGAEAAVHAAADKLYQELKNAGVDVLYDDRDLGAGEKLSDADLIGVPLRVVVSKKTLAKDMVEIKRRDESEAKLVAAEKLLHMLSV